MGVTIHSLASGSKNTPALIITHSLAVVAKRIDPRGNNEIKTAQ